MFNILVRHKFFNFKMFYSISGGGGGGGVKKKAYGTDGGVGGG